MFYFIPIFISYNYCSIVVLDNVLIIITIFIYHVLETINVSLKFISYVLCIVLVLIIMYLHFFYIKHIIIIIIMKPYLSDNILN